MQDETLLYEPTEVRFCALNPTAGYLWERLATPHSAQDLLADLCGTSSVGTPASAQAEVETFLDALVQLSLVSAVTTDIPGTPGLDSGSTPAAVAKPYASPQYRLMEESEVLTAFQVTSAGITWWVM